MNYRQVKAIEAKNKQKFLAVNPSLNDESGIYFLTRTAENGIKFAYIGQAKKILTRLAEHMAEYKQHVDNSLKKHGLFSEWNPHGWKVGFLNFPEHDLDETEQKYIKLYADKGYQLLNKTAGGQGEGKVQIAEYKPAKGYRDGLKQGYKNASRDIAHLFSKHLNVSIKSEKPNKVQEKALAKFYDFLGYHKEGEEDHGESAAQADTESENH